MAWFKVDDHLATHGKVVAAGNAAMGLWVRAGSWSSQHLTNGHVPAHVVAMLGTTGQARALVGAGLWDEADGGWQFHDWFGYQPTAAEVEELRDKRREAGRKGGIKSGEARRKQA